MYIIIKIIIILFNKLKENISNQLIYILILPPQIICKLINNSTNMKYYNLFLNIKIIL